ncbi:MAG: Fe-S cluster assembly sulfur transfer protein SufU [Gemmatimonadales bacterium]
MATLAELYQGVIIEHDRSPRNFRTLAAPTHRAEGTNPLCGDEVALEMSVNSAGQITDVGFQGRGCAVSKASASLLTTAVQGKTVAEARELFDGFHGLLTGHPVPGAKLGKLAVFEGLAAYPMRVKCATLAWHAMKQALDETK